MRKVKLMSVERYPFLPDLVFLLVGVFFATLPFMPAPAPAQESESISTVAPTVFDAFETIPADRAPREALRVTIVKADQVYLYRLNGGAPVDEASLAMHLADLGRKKKGAPVLLEDPPADVKSEVVLQFCFRCKALGLKPILLTGPQS